jgi:phosphatidylethanolamine/phosphatidyl-N-methylethanolamine N-methyltransferase
MKTKRKEEALTTRFDFLHYSDNKQFKMAKNIRQKISDFKKIGSITPSSEKLALKIVETANIKNRKVIVEFGPGNGVFTKQILKAKDPNALYFAIELNQELANETLKNCPDALVYLDSATNLSKYLKKHGIDKCDCIVSGLPFANFNEKLQDEILEIVKTSLSPDGIFLTFSYNLSLLTKAGKLFRKKLPHFFNHVKRTDTVWANLPPAFIYHATH